MTSFRKPLTVILLGIVLSISGVQVAAQGQPDAWPTYNLKMRIGPDQRYDVITILAPQTGLMLEARNQDETWVLGHTLDGVFRGWVASLYLGYRDGFRVTNLALSNEILPAPAVTPAASSVSPAVQTSYTLPDVSTIDLTSYPIIPTPTGTLYSIYATGHTRGNNPRVVAKVGDCGTASTDFLSPFFWGPYNLGDYGYLQGVIDHFGESLAYSSQAAGAGFVADAVIDPQWANPAVCLSGESALQCEYRIHKPSIAVIMFGMTDLQRRTPERFYSDLRAVIDQSIEAGVIPVLSTFPRHLAFPAESILYNQIVVRVALDYDIPLINLWLALEPLPNHGMLEDGTHLTGYVVGSAGFLVNENLQMGATLRNLITLQTLNVIWLAVMN